MCIAFGALLAFLLTTTAEQTLYVLEDSEMVWINENDGTYGTEEVTGTAQEIADQYGIAVGYTIRGINEPSSQVHMYLAVSDSDSRYAQWLNEGYPAFGQDFAIETHPISEFGEAGPNGEYQLFDASPEAETALRDALADHGLYETSSTQLTQL